MSSLALVRFLLSKVFEDIRHKNIIKKEGQSNSSLMLLFIIIYLI